MCVSVVGHTDNPITTRLRQGHGKHKSSLHYSLSKQTSQTSEFRHSAVWAGDYNLRAREAEGGESGVQGYRGLRSKFKASLGKTLPQ